MPIGSFITLVVLGVILALIYIELGGMPGKTARERGHPNADAINFLGWIGLLLGLAPWVVAMVWARMQPIGGAKLTPPAPVEPAKEKADDEETS